MILLIDGNNIASIENCAKLLSTDYGFPTQAIFGFLGKLRSWVDRFAPTRVFVAWDGGRSAKRMELHPRYKASRKEKHTPQDEARLEDLKKQIPIIRELVSCLGCYELFGAGCEADDLIGLMTRTCQENREPVVIFSTDKDFLQLVSSSVFVFRPVTGQMVTDISMPEEFGLRPYQWLDFRCVVGDDSDDIPGVKGAGKKTAKEVLDAFGTLDEFFQRAGSKLSKRAGLILNSPDIIKRNRVLMDLKNPAGDFSHADVKAGVWDPDKFSRTVANLEFRSVVETFDDWLKPFLAMKEGGHADHKD